MVSSGLLRCEVEKSGDDQDGNKVTLVKCHGRLVSDTAGDLREMVKPLLRAGGRTVVDLGAVDHLDSSGLGTLVTLKASAVKQGYCILEIVNMTPHILQLLRITKLQEILAS
jgi:anti-anti-sigma factor